MIVTFGTRLGSKNGSRHRKKVKPNFHLNCIPNQRTYLGLTQNLKKHLMRMIMSGLERKNQEVAYQECLKIEKQKN